MDLLKAMRTFVDVAETHSFSETSRRLNIVVSAVSRQVSDLEKHFGVMLLYRTTRALRLTGEGAFFLARFRNIIAELETLETQSESQTEVTGHLRISSPYNIGQLGVQRRVSQFMQSYPNVTLSWVLLNRYVNLIEEGFDLAIRVGDLPDSNFIAKKIGQIPVGFYANPDYLTKVGEPIHPKALEQFTCIVDSSIRQPGRFSYLEDGKMKTVSVSGNIQINQGRMVAEFAAMGHGIVQLPEFLVRSFVANGDLVPVLAEFNLPPRDISMVYPASKLINPTLRAFIEGVGKV